MLNENLLCSIAMNPTQSSTHTLSKQRNMENKKQELFEERYLINFLSIPQLKYYLSRYY